MKKNTLKAWTLPELLVVMILSGLIFLALLDAVGLVRRFSLHLAEQWEVTAAALEACRQMDELMSRTDSIALQDDGFQLYGREEPVALLRQTDSLLLCDFRHRSDTLFRNVRQLRLQRDTLFLWLDDHRQEVCCHWKVKKIIWR